MLWDYQEKSVQSFIILFFAKKRRNSKFNFTPSLPLPRIVVCLPAESLRSFQMDKQIDTATHSSNYNTQ